MSEEEVEEDEVWGITFFDGANRPLDTSSAISSPVATYKEQAEQAIPPEKDFDPRFSPIETAYIDKDSDVAKEIIAAEKREKLGRVLRQPIINNVRFAIEEKKIKKRKKKKKKTSKKALVLEDYRKQAGNTINVDKVFDQRKTLTQKCDKRRFESLYPDGKASELGLTLVPRGFGPNCSDSKEVGQRDAMNCYHDLYMGCVEPFLEEQLYSARVALQEAEDAHNKRVAAQNNVRLLSRGEKGIASSVPFKEPPLKMTKDVSIGDCLSALEYDGESPEDYTADKDKPGTAGRTAGQNILEAYPKTVTEAVAAICVDDNAVASQNVVEQITPTFGIGAGTVTDGSTVKQARATFQRNQTMASLGPSKGDIANCACSECMVVQNKTYTINANEQTTTDAINKNENAAPDDLIATEEPIDAGVNIPYVIGRMIIAGTIVNIDSVKSTICGAKYAKFNAVVSLSANRLDRLMRVLRFGLDVTDQIDAALEYTSDGHTYVRLHNIPKTWVANENTLDIVFDVQANVAETNIIPIENALTTNTDSVRVSTPFKRLFTVDITTRKVSERSLLTGALIKEHNVIVDVGDIWDVTPLMDIVVKPSGSSTVSVYNLVTGQTVSFQNAANAATTHFTYGLNGTFDLLKTQRYQYDTVRGNPRVELDTWAPWKKYSKFASGYIIYMTHGADAAKTIVIPAHIADFDLAEQQPYFPDKANRGGIHGNYPLPKYKSHVTVSFYALNFGTLDMKEYADNYSLAEAPLSSGTAVLEDAFEGHLKVGYPAISHTLLRTAGLASLRDNTARQMLFSPKHMKVVVFNGTSWLTQRYKSSYVEADYLDRYKSDLWLPTFDVSSAPPPLVRVKLSAVSTSDTDTGDTDSFMYIDTAKNIVQFNIVDGSHLTLGKIVENQTVVEQWYSEDGGGTVFYRTAGANEVNRVSPHAPTSSFDAALGVKKLLKLLGISSKVIESVPCFLTGFALLGSDVTVLLKNLYYTTGVHVRLNTGDGVAVIRRAENVKVIRSAHKYVTDFSTFADELQTSPSVSFSYQDAASGTRALYVREDNTDKRTAIKSNLSVYDVEAVADNIQVLSADRAKGTTGKVSLGESLRFEYDNMVFNPDAFITEIEQPSVAHAIQYPLNKALIINPLASTGGISRPVFTLTGDVGDYKANPFGLIVASDDHTMTIKAQGTMTLRTLLDHKCIFGLRNNEYVVFENVQDNNDGTYTLLETRRGVMHTHYARNFNARHATAQTDKDSGVWWVVNVPKNIPLYRKPPAVRNIVSLPQKNVPVQIPLQTRTYSKIPAPTNIRVTEDIITWTPQDVSGDTSYGTGQFLVVMHWGYMRDMADSLYLLNTLGRKSPSDIPDILSKGENRFLWAGTTQTNSISFPRSYKHYLKDSPKEYNNSPIAIPDPTIQFTSPVWWFHSNFQDTAHATLTQYPYPAFWKGYIRGGNPAHPQFYEWMKRVLLPEHKGWHWTWDGAADALQDSPEFPLLTRLTDYHGDAAKNFGKLVFPSHDGTLIAETWFPAAPIPDTVYPIRHLLSLFLYNKASKRFSFYDIASNKIEYHVPAVLYTQPGGMPDYQEVFTEKMHAIRILLDQYYGVQNPSASDVLVLNKFGLGGLYTIRTHDASGARITKMFEDAFFGDNKLYERPKDAKKVSILVAEKQTDGNYGHFEIMEDTTVERKQAWCANIRQGNTDSNKIRKGASYVAFENLNIGASMFSISYITPPYVPPVNSIKIKNSASYAVFVRDTNIAAKSTTYTVLEPK